MSDLAGSLRTSEVCQSPLLAFHVLLLGGVMLTVAPAVVFGLNVYARFERIGTYLRRRDAV